jgi:adenosylhomocysteinase
MTIQTAVLIETLAPSAPKCAGRRATSSPPRTTPPPPSPPPASRYYAWKGETEEEYEWCIEQTILKDGSRGT